MISRKKQVSLKIYEETLPLLNQYKYDLGKATGKNTSIDTAVRDLIEIATSKKYYCMYQEIGSTIIIFGIGRSENEADRDARINLGEDENIGSLDLAECTAEVYAHVIMHGGQASPDYSFKNQNGRIILETFPTN